jgi:hypothetical protein
MRRPLSEIIKEMARTVLADPERVPSSDALTSPGRGPNEAEALME